MEKYIDVRTKEEWDAGHAKGAMHFELGRLVDGELPDLPKDAKIKVYCRSGVRAEAAKKILEKAGFSSVTNAGGLSNLGVEVETD